MAKSQPGMAVIAASPCVNALAMVLGAERGVSGLARTEVASNELNQRR